MNGTTTGSKEGGIVWNEETLKSVSNGGQTVESQLHKDEQLPELWTYFCTNKASVDYSQDASLFNKVSVHPLPPALLHQYECIQMFLLSFHSSSQNQFCR